MASGTPAPTFSLVDAPSWLSIDPNSGIVSGVAPIGVTSFAYQVEASSSAGHAFAGPFTVNVTWPTATAGFSNPNAHAAEGYYLGVDDNRWTLEATHPGTSKVTFKGTITIDKGTFSLVTPIALEPTDKITGSGNTITFSLTNLGGLDGLRFTTSQKAARITFNLEIDGQPAKAGQIHIGSAGSAAPSASPLRVVR